jgi:hypothetical protein
MNPGDVLVHLVHLGHYKYLKHSCFLCVASFDAPSLAKVCVLEEVDHPSALLPVPPSLSSRQLQWRVD